MAYTYLQLGFFGSPLEGIRLKSPSALLPKYNLSGINFAITYM